jgi:phosphoribosylformylglycinamidine synthase
VPITGGNVSFYNETDGRSIHPTPVVGVVGLLEHADRVVGRRFQEPGDIVVLLGEAIGALDGSEYLWRLHGLLRGVPCTIDLETERSLQALLVELAGERLMRSAHDCSEGGIAVTLAEGCFDTGGIGVEASIDAVDVARSDRINRAASLFGESPSRVVISTSTDNVTDVLSRAAARGVTARVIGRTGGNLVRISVGGHPAVDLPVAEAERAWSTAIERHFSRRAA